jgi:Sulfotransferase family
MPNAANITAPITLFGYGRSGTSLLFKSFLARNDTDCVGESANLIFTTWRALEQVSGLTRYGKIESKAYQADAAGLVQSAFSRIYPSERKYWMQKPIGTPRIMWDFNAEEQKTFPEWYWMVFNSSFPDARKFAIVRNPNDVFLSAREYWKYPDDAIWRTQYMMYKIMNHPNSGLRCVLKYEDVVANRDVRIRELTKALGIDFQDRMLAPFNELHVPQIGKPKGSETELKEKKSKGFSHQDEWAGIADTPNRALALEEYQKLASRA